MTQSTAQKDEFTTALRAQITKTIAQATETDRADDSLCTLSFQSTIYPERHAWIDTADQSIKIDLEDWQDESEWDNAIARVTIAAEITIELLQDWFSNNSLDKYANLNKNYGIVTKKLVIV
jgi:hypothetical protein